MRDVSVLSKSVVLNLCFVKNMLDETLEICNANRHTYRLHTCFAQNTTIHHSYTFLSKRIDSGTSWQISCICSCWWGHARIGQNAWKLGSGDFCGFGYRLYSTIVLENGNISTYMLFCLGLGSRSHSYQRHWTKSGAVSFSVRMSVSFQRRADTLLTISSAFRWGLVSENFHDEWISNGRPSWPFG